MSEPTDDAYDHERALRLVEALLFASATPVTEEALSARLPPSIPPGAILEELRDHYRHRGVTLVRIAGGWTFRTAPDLAGSLALETVEVRKPTRAQLETLAIIAYHQPVTRAEIEEIRGVALHKGTLDIPDGIRLGGAEGTARDAGPAGHLGHDRGVPQPFWPGYAQGPAECGRAESGRAARRPCRGRDRPGGRPCRDDARCGRGALGSNHTKGIE